MDEVTQQNSALVEENAATAKTLEQQARAMDERIAFFRIAENDTQVGGLKRSSAQGVPVAPHSRPKAPAASPSAPAAAVKAQPAKAQAHGAARNPIRRMQSALAEAWKDF
jgi:hypothetical protein